MKLSPLFVVALIGCSSVLQTQIPAQAQIQTQTQASAIVKVGLSPNPYPPFVIPQSDGSWSGFEVDLVRALCTQAQIQCELVGIDWAGLIPALNAGKIDMVFNSLSITPERREIIDYSLPYFKDKSVFLIAKDSGLNALPEGMAGKSIGVSLATTQATYLNTYYNQSVIKYYNTSDELNSDLAAGRIDASLTDAVQALAFLETPEGAHLADSGVWPNDPLLGEGYAAAFRKGEDALRAKFDGAISEVLKSGAYDTIQKKYFQISFAP